MVAGDSSACFLRDVTAWAARKEKVLGIVLFGSAARRAVDIHSDLDVTVVVRATDRRLETSIRDIACSHFGQPLSEDWIVSTVRACHLYFGRSVTELTANPIDLCFVRVEQLPSFFNLRGGRILFDRGGIVNRRIRLMNQRGTSLYVKRMEALRSAGLDRLKYLPGFFFKLRIAARRGDLAAASSELHRVRMALIAIAAALKGELWERLKGGHKYLDPFSRRRYLATYEMDLDAAIDTLEGLLRAYLPKFGRTFLCAPFIERALSLLPPVNASRPASRASHAMMEKK